MKTTVLFLSILIISGCAGVATKYKFDKIVRDCHKFEFGCLIDEETGKKMKTIYKKVPVEEYRCKGAGCDAEFETGGKMKAGEFIKLPAMKISN